MFQTRWSLKRIIQCVCFCIIFLCLLSLSLVFRVEDWEKELVAELQDYEVVGEQKSNKKDGWEQEMEEIEEMLNDGIDLK